MSKNDDQFALAEKYGYVESRGSEHIRPGSLVPYNHPTSPLTYEQIEQLRNAGCEVGKIQP